MTGAVLLLCATLTGLQAPAASAGDVERAIADVDQRFNRAVEQRDAAELENVLADPFTWIHAYVTADGRTFRLEWDVDSLMATLPNDVRTQVFLKSPTEEATALPEHFVFTLDATGRPTVVRSMRGSTETWRAERKN